MKRETTTGVGHGDNFCYYYLHASGELIHKPMSYDPAGFEESAFVKKWWIIDLDNRLDAYNMVISAKLSGANADRVFDLAIKWMFTNEDCQIYCKKIGLLHKSDGNHYHVQAPDYITSCGAGVTMFEAICNFYEEATKRT
jgi:hypothetical protein